MRTAIGTVVLVLCLCGARLEAQETASQAMPPQEAKQEVSRGVPITMTVNDQNHVRLSPQVFGKKSLKNENGAEAAPPFPVSIPVAIVYPRKAVRKGWEGHAVIAAEILPDGSVGRMALARSSGHEVLDNAAQNAIKTWKFGPVPEEDDAVPQYVDIPVAFKIEDR